MISVGWPLSKNSRIHLEILIQLYVASFNELKKDTGYNDEALIDKFEKGLNSALVDKIYNLPEMPTTLKGWIQWATKLDRQWRQREAKKKVATTPTTRQVSPSFKPPARTFQPTPAPAPSQTAFVTKESDVVPIEIDSGWKKVRSIICYKCRKPGHIAKNCPSSVDINSMDFDTLKAYMKEELAKEEESSKENF
ncbi:hypothetical protein M422DRAFT_263484 [Sphaerobolus stellatus SS14]|uniref:CCHC-type domain-containing protein n=1 Tax=Sphaerobolus stellatus (strain SS14) TaxID=990650 RepID=A0A0C9TVZ8_SPHS4|nr:hypothetical protein M422DRAFT_263484 [Sphaerobolus stellatus SS14]